MQAKASNTATGPMRRVLAQAAAWLALTWTALGAGGPACAYDAPERPFRFGLWELNRDLDHDKPLAAFDPAGFVVNSQVLIGAFSDKWVGGMSLSTRRMQWWLEASSTLTAPPGSFGGSVVLGFRDGKIICVDALNGKKKWTAELDSFAQRPFLLNATTLYVITAAQVLYALDFQTGKTLWLYDGGFPEGLLIHGGARPVFHDNKIIFGNAAGELTAVAADSGKVIWAHYNPSYSEARFHDIVGEMVVRNNKLIISRYDGLVAAIDLAASMRNVVWQEKLPGITTSVYRGDRYYVGGLNGDVYAMDPDHAGRRIWRQVTGTAVSTLTAGETQLFVAGAGGRVTALDQGSGAIRWYDRLGSALASPPTIYENVLYYTTGMKNLYAFRLK